MLMRSSAATLPRAALPRPEREPAHGPLLALPARIPSLDGLRAISICLVLGRHAADTIGGAHGEQLFGTTGWFGQLGVSTFFVISGFLITHLLLRERDKTGSISLKGFYARRAFRILPAYYLMLLVVFLLQRAGVIGIKTVDLIGAATFTWNYLPSTGSWWVGHSWSLSVEEQFYLFWPLLLCVVGPRGGRKAAVALLLIVPIVRAATLFALPPSHFLVQRVWMTGHTRLDTIMFGAVAALFYRDAWFQALVRRLFDYKAHLAALVFLFGVSVVAFAQWRGRYLAWGGYTLEAACITLLLLWAVQNPGTVVGRVLNCKPVVHVGMISFSLYLWQQFFLASRNTSIFGQLPLNLLCVAAAAEISFFCVERPFLRLRERLSGHGQGAEKVASAPAADLLPSVGAPALVPTPPLTPIGVKTTPPVAVPRARA